ncbi:DNA mismatch repair protein mutS [Leclercia adecarboxylata]|uniref:DNA mismatch repair protein mutS n=1 Tax=Leclercia adecarboxylata TaxID=83655 RepID=A0A4U9IG13_9ENTR|nr:DNA mismatch repair protein mutS [Leclercia adecarboxylata]
MSLLVPAEETSPALEALENLDPDTLSPRQALEWIYRFEESGISPTRPAALRLPGLREL